MYRSEHIVSTLPSAKVENEIAVVEEVPMERDIDTQFKKTVKRALLPRVQGMKEKAMISVTDSFKAFRKKLVAMYIFSNPFCVFVMNDSFNSLTFLVRMKGSNFVE